MYILLLVMYMDELFLCATFPKRDPKLVLHVSHMMYKKNQKLFVANWDL